MGFRSPSSSRPNEPDTLKHFWVNSDSHSPNRPSIVIPDKFPKPADTWIPAFTGRIQLPLHSKLSHYGSNSYCTQMPNSSKESCPCPCTWQESGILYTTLSSLLQLRSFAWIYRKVRSLSYLYPRAGECWGAHGSSQVELVIEHTDVRWHIQKMSCHSAVCTLHSKF